MPLEAIFQPFATELDATLVTGMADVVRGGLEWARPQLRALLVLYVAIHAAAFMLTAYITGKQLAWATILAMTTAAALNAANYTYWVQDFFFTTLPNSIAAGLHGPRVTLGAAQQFDALWNAASNVHAQILERSGGLLRTGERIMSWAFLGICLGGLGCMFIPWMISRVFMAVVICLGPFLIPLYLFQATRPFVQSWIGKLVGLTSLNLAASILLRILMAVMDARVRRAQAIPGASIDVMLHAFAGLSVLFVIAAVLMFTLPSAVAIGSAMGAGQAASAAAGAGLARGAATMAGGATAGGVQALTRAIQQLRRRSGGSN